MTQFGSGSTDRYELTRASGQDWFHLKQRMGNTEPTVITIRSVEDLRIMHFHLGELIRQIEREEDKSRADRLIYALEHVERRDVFESHHQ